MYFYIGQFSQNAIEQTAGLNAELFNEKMDKNLKNTNATTNCILEAPNGIGNNPAGATTLEFKKGLKLLAPDGRNDDGTMKNVEIVLTENKTLDINPSWNSPLTVYVNAQGNLAVANYLVQHAEPNINRNSLWYDSKSNKMYRQVNGVRNEVQVCVLGTFFHENGVLKSINGSGTSSALHLLSYADSKAISNFAFPSRMSTSLTLGASGSTYTAPANGWYYLQKQTTTNGQYCTIANTTKVYRQTFIGYTVGCNALFPVCKDDEITISYNLGGTTNNFKFIYALGEV